MDNIEQIEKAVEEVNRQALLLSNDDADIKQLQQLWEANIKLTHQIENKIAELRGLNG